MIDLMKRRDENLRLNQEFFEQLGIAEVMFSVAS